MNCVALHGRPHCGVVECSHSHAGGFKNCQRRFDRVEVHLCIQP